jgi:hypothetical protein
MEMRVFDVAFAGVYRLYECLGIWYRSLLGALYALSLAAGIFLLLITVVLLTSSSLSVSLGFVKGREHDGLGIHVGVGTGGGRGKSLNKEGELVNGD